MMLRDVKRRSSQELGFASCNVKATTHCTLIIKYGKGLFRMLMYGLTFLAKLEGSLVFYATLKTKNIFFCEL